MSIYLSGGGANSLHPRVARTTTYQVYLKASVWLNFVISYLVCFFLSQSGCFYTFAYFSMPRIRRSPYMFFYSS